MNIKLHFAAKQQETVSLLGVGGDQTRVNTGLIFAKRPKTSLLLNANVALCLLDAKQAIFLLTRQPHQLSGVIKFQICVYSLFTLPPRG